MTIAPSTWAPTHSGYPIQHAHPDSPPEWGPLRWWDPTPLHWHHVQIGDESHVEEQGTCSYPQLLSQCSLLLGAWRVPQ